MAGLQQALCIMGCDVSVNWCEETQHRNVCPCLICSNDTEAKRQNFYRYSNLFERCALSLSQTHAHAVCMTQTTSKREYSP